MTEQDMQQLRNDGQDDIAGFIETLQADNAKLTAERDELLKNQAKRDLEMKAQGCFEAISEIKGLYVHNRLLFSAVGINNFAASLTKQAEGL